MTKLTVNSQAQDKHFVFKRSLLVLFFSILFYHHTHHQVSDELLIEMVIGYTYVVGLFKNLNRKSLYKFWSENNNCFKTNSTFRIKFKYAS